MPPHDRNRLKHLLRRTYIGPFVVAVLLANGMEGLIGWAQDALADLVVLSMNTLASRGVFANILPFQRLPPYFWEGFVLTTLGSVALLLAGSILGFWLYPPRRHHA